tara:strand:+ start:185 stop:499 length:315 start_codon:yes stop_codon:yes gene_type:complete
MTSPWERGTSEEATALRERIEEMEQALVRTGNAVMLQATLIETIGEALEMYEAWLPTMPETLYEKTEDAPGLVTELLQGAEPRDVVRRYGEVLEQRRIKEGIET